MTKNQLQYHKLSNTIKQAKNVSQVGDAKKDSTHPLHSKTTKTETFFDEKKIIKNAKITKRSDAHTDCASKNTVEVLNSLSPELQLKDTESYIQYLTESD